MKRKMIEVAAILVLASCVELVGWGRIEQFLKSLPVVGAALLIASPIVRCAASWVDLQRAPEFV